MKRTHLAILAGALLVVLVVAAAIVTQVLAAQKPSAPGSTSTDPQALLIPRWFLRALTLDGKPVAIAADQQTITIQFTPDGNASGKGGCNGFGTTYQAGKDGKLSFGQTMSTMMACPDGMDQESAYFAALAQVKQFKIDAGQLVLSSADGQTILTFSKPPK